MSYVIQGDFIKVNPSASLLTHKRRPGRRGKVLTFSVSSRKRLKRLLASTRWNNALFVTLTAREDIEYSQVVAFEKRYTRRWGAHAMVWRKEYQSRGVVHYHLLIMTKAWLPIKWLIRIWSEILGDNGSVSVRFVKSRSKVGYYISKYMAKLDDVAAQAARSVSGAAAWAGILDNSNISCRGGRFWGVFNRAKLVYYPVRMVKRIPEKAREVEESIREWLRNNELSFVSSFSLVFWGVST